MGQAIGQVRKEQDIGVGEIAGKAGIGKRRIARLEAGKDDPDFELLLKLACALNIKPPTLAARARALDTREGVAVMSATPLSKGWCNKGLLPGIDYWLDPSWCPNTRAVSTQGSEGE